MTISVSAIRPGTSTQHHGLSVDSREIRVTIHDLIPDLFEFTNWETFREEVRQVLRRWYIGNSQLAVLDGLSDKEMAPFDMLTFTRS